MSSSPAKPRTLAEKVWDDHVVVRGEVDDSGQRNPDLIYIDLHLVHEVTSPQAFDGLRMAGRPVRRTDLTIASREHARFKQTDADVGSFDGGYGSAYLAKMVGQKFAREIFFLGRAYTAEDMHRMGAVNLVADHAEVEAVALQVAAEINGKSPTAQRMLKFAFNLADDGLAGQQVFAGEATRLAYMTDEAVEGRDSFLQKRKADWSRFPYYF